jgi:uncharacterized membrane protein YqjE
MNEIINFVIDKSGDPYISSWINTLFYGCSFVTAIYKRKSLKNEQHSYGDQHFWLFLIIVLFALGINKQFDFQTALIEAGRQIAQYGNWYEKRRLVQAWFGYGLCGVIIFFLFTMLMRLSTRQFWRHNALAAIGLGILCIYVVVRTASISHFSLVADSRSEGEFRVTDIIEFFGILCIFVNTLTRYKQENERTFKND